MNAEVRRLVFERARGRCECGCGGPAEHLDHFFGRAKAFEAVANCWALSARCDLAKTTNRPSAAYWLRIFVKHCERHSYADEAQRARDRLFFVETREGFFGKTFFRP